LAPSSTYFQRTAIAKELFEKMMGLQQLSKHRMDVMANLAILEQLGAEDVLGQKNSER
jgi:hypothetical protein